MQRAQNAQSSTRPKLLQALIDAWRQPDVRTKIVFTLAMLIVFRFLAHIPVPEVNPEQLDNAFDNNPVLGFLNLFSGGGLENLSIVALGVYPYITASIVMNLLTPMIPKLQELSREGESGRKRISQYTHRGQRGFKFMAHVPQKFVFRPIRGFRRRLRLFGQQSGILFRLFGFQCFTPGFEGLVF